MAQKIVIGVTGPNRGGLTAWLMTALAVRRCGARPVRITASRPIDKSQLDAVIIGGGTDVDPFHYGEKRQPESHETDQHSTPVDWLVGLALAFFRIIFATRSVQDYDPDRDQMEKELVKYAIYHDLSVLGICRGAQLMNVVLGGTLHQDIGHFYTEDTSNVRSVLPRKSISVIAGSHLQTMLGTRACLVNALHRQSINRLGEDIVVSATEPNGVIQAIEKCDHRFFIGVQWHPEYMPQSATQHSLFRGLVHSATTRVPAND